MLIPDDRDPYLFVFRVIRLPYHTLKISVDEGEPLRFSCDFVSCTPLARGGEESLMSQMDSGDTLHIRAEEATSEGEIQLLAIPLVGLK